ncbi:unnamed protein product [Cunninghamella blakesleeana]
MPITLNPKNRFSFLNKKKDSGLKIKMVNLSPSELAYNHLNTTQKNDPDHLIDNEDIYTIKTNDDVSTSSSLLFTSPTLTAITKENEDISILEDLVEKEEKEIKLPSTLSFLKDDDHHLEMNESSSGLYSNFYLKLPNGKWLVKVRTREKKTLGTFELDSYMI